MIPSAICSLRENFIQVSISSTKSDVFFNLSRSDLYVWNSAFYENLGLYPGKILAISVSQVPVKIMIIIFIIMITLCHHYHYDNFDLIIHYHVIIIILSSTQSCDHHHASSSLCYNHYGHRVLKWWRHKNFLRFFYIFYHVQEELKKRKL